jgi:thiamine monophosphate kinase
LGTVVRQWFAGVDLQTWAESDWAANGNLEGGMRLSRSDGERGVRIAVSGYAGRSLQRILATERERYLSAGLVFEF